MATVYLMGDFETTTQFTETTNGNITLIQENNNTRVWASCLVHVESGKVVHLENNIDETFKYLKELSKYTNVTIYYHNLKFDGEFWLQYLLKNGFVYNDKLDCKNSMSTLITDTGAFYQLTFKFNKGKNANKITLLDSLKILPLPVKDLAKSFGLPIKKGEINYHGKRKINHIITTEEKGYIENDCKIVASCIKELHQQGLNKLTLASNALANYKALIGSAEFKARYPRLEGLHNNGKNSNIVNGRELGVKTIDDYIRKSYKGGYTYVSKLYKNTDLICDGQTYDVNSLYPSVMYYDILPYSTPIYYTGEYVENSNYPLYIQKIKCKFKLKKGFVPIIQIKGNCRFGETEYLETSGCERVELTLTNIDLEMIKKHYTLTRLEYIDGYMFKGGKNLFKEYIEYWVNQKISAENNGNTGLRQISKLMLNSLYGKFAQSPSGLLKQPFIDENGITSMELIEGEERDTVYTAMASFITAYARRVTISAIMEVGGENKGSRFCYADTDSIHLIGTQTPNIYIHKTNLGAWKFEGTWKQAKFIRAKTYFEIMDINKSKVKTDNIFYTHFDVKCAGMPSNLKKKVTTSNFNIGLVLSGKLIPRRFEGGVMLISTDFSIK